MARVELSEREVVDRVVAWFCEYVGTHGTPRVMKLNLINRRWGQQLRRFGPSCAEVLLRDPRVAMMMNRNGGQDVTVSTLSYDEAKAQRKALHGL